MTNSTASVSLNGMPMLLKRKGKTTLARCLDEVKTHRQEAHQARYCEKPAEEPKPVNTGGPRMRPEHPNTLRPGAIEGCDPTKPGSSSSGMAPVFTCPQLSVPPHQLQLPLPQTGVAVSHLAHLGPARFPGRVGLQFFLFSL